MTTEAAFKYLACGACLLLLGACNKHIAAVHPPPPPAQTAAPAAPVQAARPSPATAVAVSRQANLPDTATKLRIEDLLGRLQDAYFDYDKHALRQDAVVSLQSDAQSLTKILRQYPSYKLTVQGYCDERGSDEYNLALGDARAKNAEQYLVTLGLPASQLKTMSYGKEHPVCTEHSEACWQKNRRAHVTQEQAS